MVKAPQIGGHIGPMKRTALTEVSLYGTLVKVDVDAVWDAGATAADLVDEYGYTIMTFDGGDDTIYKIMLCDCDDGDSVMMATSAGAKMASFQTDATPSNMDPFRVSDYWDTSMAVAAVLAVFITGYRTNAN